MYIGGFKVSLVPGPSCRGVQYNPEGGRVYPVGRVYPEGVGYPEGRVYPPGSGGHCGSRYASYFLGVCTCVHSTYLP